MKATISIEFKPGVLDPEASAIAKSLQALGFDEVQSVRRVKQIEVELASANEHDARQAASRMCEQLLANPVIETYSIELNG